MQTKLILGKKVQKISIEIQNLIKVNFSKFFFFFNLFILILPNSLYGDNHSEEFLEALETCNGCHGKEVLSEDPSVPLIHGQSFQYIYRQLKDYKLNVRSHEIMTLIASGLKKKIMMTLAEHFSGEDWSEFRTETNYDEKLALDIISAGQCSQCHGTFNSSDLAAPRLAGQKESYLIQTMTAFKNRTRLNAPDKSSLFETISEDEIKAMAGYLANK